MPKFSQIPTNNSPALTDFQIGVTSAGVDYKATLAQLAALVSANISANAIGAAAMAAGATYLGGVSTTSGDNTYSTASYVDMVGLTGVSFTTTRANQKVLIMMKCQSYGAASIVIPNIDGSTVANANQLPFGASTTATAMAFWNVTVATPGSHTLKMQIKGTSNRIIHNEGEGSLQAFAVF